MNAAQTARPGILQLLSRACAAEWPRLHTIRTTWWCVLAAAVTIVGMGATLAFDVSNDVRPAHTLPAAWEAGEFPVLPGQFALLVLVVLAVTSEYASGAIGTTLQWTPRRPILLAARTIVPVAFATLVGTLLTLIADLLAWGTSPRSSCRCPSSQPASPRSPASWPPEA